MVRGGGHSPARTIVERVRRVDTVRMGLRRSALVVALCASVAAGACGFSEEGTLEATTDSGAGSSGNPSGSDAASGTEGSMPASGAGDAMTSGSMGVPVCSPPSCNLPTAPAGWQLVLYGTSRGDACPIGFDTTDPIESPVASANACACAACVKTGTTCSTGSIATKTDNGGGACGTSSSTLDGNNGGCQNTGGNFGQDDLVLAPTAVKGTCTSAGTPVPANVTSQPLRLCTPQASTCSSGACGVPASMKACIATTGDVACPSGTKHVVGSGVSLVCPSCGCTISSATCGGGMDFYPQSNCNGTSVTLTSGVCKQTGGTFQSFKWKGIVAAEVCTTTPVAPTTTTLTAVQTVCCP